MYDITFKEMLVAYLIFSGVYITLSALYFKYRRKRTVKFRTEMSLHRRAIWKNNNSSGQDEFKKQLHDCLMEGVKRRDIPPADFSEAQKDIIRELARVVSCRVSSDMCATVLRSVQNQQSVTTPNVEPMTKEEIQKEPVIPVVHFAGHINPDSGVYCEEIVNLADVMQGKGVSLQSEMFAGRTTRKLIGTELFDQMMQKIEGAKENLTGVMSKIAAKYSDPTSDNPYRIYENIDFMPLKKG